MPMNARLLRPRAAVSTGFDPRSIGTMLGWWDASDASTVTLVDGFVSQWNDKSGNGRNVSQATEAARPSVGTVNSRSAIYFDGSNDWLTGTGVSPAGTLILAVRPNRTGNETYFYNGVTTPAINVVAIGTGANAAVGSERRTASGFSHRQSSVGATVGATNIYSATVFSQPPGLLRVNGAAGSTSASTSFAIVGNSAALAFGGASANGVLARPFQGHICEVLFYEAELSAVAIAAAEQYLAAKWGVTLVTPPTASNADAQDWLNRVYDNGGTVSASTAAAVNTFCNAIDAESGLRAAILRLNLFCGNSDANLAAVRTPLYLSGSLGGAAIGNTIDANVNFSQSDYAETGASGGLKGNGTTKYLNTGFNYSSLASANSTHLSASGTDLEQSGDRMFISCFVFPGDLSSLFSLDINTGSQQRTFRSTNVATPIFTSTGTVESHFIGTRTASNFSAIYRGGSLAASSTAVAAPATAARPLFVFAGNNNGTPNSYTAARLRMYSIGNGLTAAQALAFSNAVVAFNTALGRA